MTRYLGTNLLLSCQHFECEAQYVITEVEADPDSFGAWRCANLREDWPEGWGWDYIDVNRALHCPAHRTTRVPRRAGTALPARKVPNEVEYGGRIWDPVSRHHYEIQRAKYAVVDVADDNYGQGLIIRYRDPRAGEIDVVIDADDFEGAGRVLSYV